MSSFTDEEREAEARRRQRQWQPTANPLTVTCLHCHRNVPAHEVASREHPICDICF